MSGPVKRVTAKQWIIRLHRSGVRNQLLSVTVSQLLDISLLQHNCTNKCISPVGFYVKSKEHYLEFWQCTGYISLNMPRLFNQIFQCFWVSCDTAVSNFLEIYFHYLLQLIDTFQNIEANNEGNTEVKLLLYLSNNQLVWRISNLC